MTDDEILMLAGATRSEPVRVDSLEDGTFCLTSTEGEVCILDDGGKWTYLCDGHISGVGCDSCGHAPVQPLFTKIPVEIREKIRSKRSTIKRVELAKAHGVPVQKPASAPVPTPGVSMDQPTLLTHNVTWDSFAPGMFGTIVDDGQTTIRWRTPNSSGKDFSHTGSSPEYSYESWKDGNRRMVHESCVAGLSNAQCDAVAAIIKNRPAAVAYAHSLVETADIVATWPTSGVVNPLIDKRIGTALARCVTIRKAGRVRGASNLRSFEVDTGHALLIETELARDMSALTLLCADIFLETGVRTVHFKHGAPHDPTVLRWSAWRSER